MTSILRHCVFSWAVTLAVVLAWCADSSHAHAANRTEDITFDDIKFEMKKGAPFDRDLLSKKIEGYEGRKIRIRGYILPSFRQKGIQQFVLVRDNMECCFGPGAALFDAIIVKMAEGKTTSYTIRPVAVEGTFRIREVRGPDGKHLAIYFMTADEVK
jgi:hypothetical protein